MTLDFAPEVAEYPKSSQQFWECELIVLLH